MNTPRLSLPLLIAAQAYKHATLNEAQTALSCGRRTGQHFHPPGQGHQLKINKATAANLASLPF